MEPKPWIMDPQVIFLVMAQRDWYNGSDVHGVFKGFFIYWAMIKTANKMWHSLQHTPRITSHPKLYWWICFLKCFSISMYVES